MKSALRQLRNQGAPVPFSGRGQFKLSDLAMGGTDGEAMMRCYGVMGTVYSCVSLYAEATARTEWKLYRKQPKDGRVRYTTTDSGSDQRTEVVNHAALDLINKPNDFWTRSRLFETDQMYLDLTGEHYWIIDRSGGLTFPTAIWPVRPDRMEPVPDPDKYITGWLYTSPDGQQKIPLGVDEVIQVAYPNPLDPLHGLGPVQAILVDIDSAKYSAEWNRNFFINSARPDGIITVPGDLTDTEFLAFQDRWRETHRGVSRAHRVAILENGATWMPTAPSQKDMDFTALRNLSRDIVREAFRMHKVMIGVSDDVNRANAQTGEEVFAAWGVVPRLDRKKDMLNNVFLPMFGSTGAGVEFDYVTPVPANREQDMAELTAKATAAQVLVSAGFDAHNVLEVVGLPDMDVDEKATQQPGLPPGWVPAPPPAPGQPAPPQAPAPGDSGTAADTADMVARLQKMLANGHVTAGTGRR